MQNRHAFMGSVPDAVKTPTGQQSWGKHSFFPIDMFSWVYGVFLQSQDMPGSQRGGDNEQPAPWRKPVMHLLVLSPGLKYS